MSMLYNVATNRGLNFKHLNFTSIIVLLLAICIPIKSLQAQTVYTIGTGTSNLATAGITPLATGWEDNRMQYLYLASELTAAGVPAASNPIHSIAFNITTLGSVAPTNVNVKIGTIAAATPSISTITEGLGVVYTAATLTINSTGWFTFPFATPFTWNGTDNILIEVCRDNASFGSSFAVQCTQFAVGISRTYGFYNDAVAGCTMTTGNTASATNRRNRPNARFSIGALPSCLPPTSLLGAASSVTSANLNWTASTSSPSSGYEWEVRTSGAGGSGASGRVDFGTTAVGVVSSNTALLSASTAYTLYVRANCGGGDYSSWAASSAFVTPCNSIGVPYTMPISAAVAPVLPSCVTVINTNADSRTWVTAATANFTVQPAGFTLPALAIFYNTDGVTGHNDWLFTQGLNLTGGVSYTVNYKYGNDGGTLYPERLSVAYGTTATAAGMTNTLATYASVTGVPVSASNIFVPATTGVYYIGFQAYSLADMDYLLLDDISVIETPSCLSPTTPLGSASSLTSANLSWTAPAIPPTSGYEWEVRTSGAAGSGATGLTSSGNTGAGVTTASVSGLTYPTAYTLYVRSNCGAGNFSTWTASATFSSLCTIINSFPYNQGFNLSANCWSVGGTGPWYYAGVSAGGDITTTQSGTGAMFKTFSTISTAIASSPALDLSSFAANSAVLNFWLYRHTSAPAADNYRIYINSSPSVTGATLLGTYASLITGTPTGAIAGWNNYSLVVPSTWNSAGYVYVIIAGQTTNASLSYDLGFDNFTVRNGIPDAAVTNIYSLGKIPLNYGTPHVVTARIANPGEVVMTNVPVTLSITGSNTFSDVKTIASLPVGGSAIVTFAGYSPTVIGSNLMTVSIPSGDVNSANDSQTWTQLTTNTSYSFKNTAIANTGGVGSSTAASDFVGKFTTTTSALINEIKVEFQTAGNPYRVGIWDASGISGAPGASAEPLWQSAVLTTAVGTAIIPVPDFAVAAGSFYIGVRQTTATNVSFSYQAETPIRTGVFYFKQAATTAWADFAPNNSFRFNIEVGLNIPVPPNCVTNTLPVDGGSSCVSSTTVLSWANGGGGTTGYKVYFGTTTNPPLVQDITSAATLTYTPAGPLVAGQIYYWKVVPYNTVGDAVTCTAEHTFTVDLEGCYCKNPVYSAGSASCANNFGITNFTFAGINSTTTCNGVTPFYNYYASATATAAASTDNNFSVSLLGTTAFITYFKIYIDYNDNGSFDDAGEQVYASANLNSVVGPFTGTITINPLAPVGTHRLRVRLADDDVNSCTGDGIVGEVEDYNITILSAPTCLPPTGVAITEVTQSSAKITWGAPASTSPEEYAIYYGVAPLAAPNGGTAPSISGIGSTERVLSSLTGSTNYIVYIRSNCGVDGNSVWAGPFSFSTECAPLALPVANGLNSLPVTCWKTTVVANLNTQATGLAPALTYVTQGVSQDDGYATLTPQEGSGFYRFNSYDCDQGDQIRLYTDVNTTGVSKVAVYFKWANILQYSDRDNVVVQYSLDGGTTWLNGGDTILRRNTNFADGWRPIELGLPLTVSNQPSVLIGFLFTGAYGNDCFIDDINIQQAPPVPAAPTALSFSATSSFATTLTWADNATTETSYIVSSSADNVNFTPLATLAANSITYTAVNLTPLTLYYFNVVAVNTGGESAPANGNVTTLACESFTTNTWIGAVSTTGNWNLASNWSLGRVPNACDDVVITPAIAGAAANYFININSPVTIRSLTLEPTYSAAGVKNLIVFTQANALNILGDLTISTNRTGGTALHNTYLLCGPGTITVNGNTTIGNTGNRLAAIGSYGTASTITFKGNVNMGAQAFFNSGHLISFVFDAAGAQLLTSNSTLTSTTPATYGFGNFVVGATNAPAVTLAGTGTSAQWFVINNLVVNAGSLTIPSGFALNRTAVGGSASLAAGTTLQLGGSTEGFTGSNFPTNYGSVVIDPTSTVVYNGTAAQTIRPVTYGNLNINNSAGVTATTSTTVAGGLALTSGAFDLGNNNTLSVAGAVTGAGSLASYAGSNLILGGNANALSFTAASAINNLTLGAVGSTVGIATPLNVYGAITWSNASTLNFNGNAIVLKSTAAGTASVGEVLGTLSGATNVTVERYLPEGHRAWRLLTIPVSGTQTLRQAWANGTAPLVNSGAAAAQATGRGTIITGHGYVNGTAANNAGYDWINLASAASSIRSYVVNGSSGSFPATLAATPSLSTTATAAHNAGGYMLFVRGDRTVTTEGPNATTLAPKGTLKTGLNTYTVPPAATAKFKVLGNPYASPIDFDDIMANGTNNTVISATNFWTWGASTGTSGGYTAHTKVGPMWISAPPLAEGTPQYIQSGQAILVQNSATGGTLIINEEDKVASNALAPVFMPVTLPRLYANLSFNDNETYKVADGVMVAFDASFKDETTDASDVVKMVNPNENISLVRNGVKLAIEARPQVTANDTLYIAMENVKQRAYALELNAMDMPSGVTAILKDKYLGTDTDVLLAGDTRYNFTVTNATASSLSDRFVIVFKTESSLPITVSKAKAYELNNGVQIDWSTVNEQKISNFEVEKSTTGNNYKKIGSASAKGQPVNNYGLFDAAPVKGINYYRIKMVRNDGAVAYSEVMKVSIVGSKQGFAIYPNPVKNRQIGLQLSDLPKGTYTIALYNGVGQQILAKVIEHNGGNGTAQIELSRKLSAGVYRVSLENSESIKLSQTLVME